MPEKKRKNGYRLQPVEPVLIPLPPAGFRKSIPLRIRYLVLVRQRGLDPDDGEPLDPIREGIDFDHRRCRPGCGIRRLRIRSRGPMTLTT